MVRKLPTVVFKGKAYFMDYRLGQFRSIQPPLEFIPFNSDLGREIYQEYESTTLDNPIVVSCPKCGKILFEGTKRQARRLIIYCADCPAYKTDS